MEELNLVVFLILVVSLCVLYWHERRIHRIRLNQLTSQVESLGKNIAELRQREKVIFQASQRFVEASCEHEIIDQVLHLTIDITGASGASFVALDERGQPQASKRLGEFPFPIPEAWLEYLASPSIRHGCQECKNLGILMKTCPLLKGPFSDAYGLYCLPLRHGERELGIINVYIHEAGILQPDTQSFLQSLYDYTALALEVLGLRKQELAALGGISTFRKRTDLRSSLKELLVELSNALELETALIAIPSLDSGQNIVSASFDLDDAISIGKDFSEEDKEFVEAQIKASIAGKEDISLTNRKKQLPSRNALWITPLHFDDRSIPIGILAAVKGSGESIEQRHLTLVEMAANQAAHLIQAAQHFAEVEYKAMIE